MTNRPEFLISWFAIARIGAIISPMNPSYKEREVAYQLNDSDAVAIVVQGELLPLVQAVHAQTPALKHIITVGLTSRYARPTCIPLAISCAPLRQTPPTS
jgi:long-chain acyl-CoA synthetase